MERWRILCKGILRHATPIARGAVVVAVPLLLIAIVLGVGLWPTGLVKADNCQRLSFVVWPQEGFGYINCQYSIDDSQWNDYVTRSWHIQWCPTTATMHAAQAVALPGYQFSGWFSGALDSGDAWIDASDSSVIWWPSRPGTTRIFYANFTPVSVAIEVRSPDVGLRMAQPVVGVSTCMVGSKLTLKAEVAPGYEGLYGFGGWVGDYVTIRNVDNVSSAETYVYLDPLEQWALSGDRWLQAKSEFVGGAGELVKDGGFEDGAFGTDWWLYDGTASFTSDYKHGGSYAVEKTGTGVSRVVQSSWFRVEPGQVLTVSWYARRDADMTDGKHSVGFALYDLDMDEWVWYLAKKTANSTYMPTPGTWYSYSQDYVMESATLGSGLSWAQVVVHFENNVSGGIWIDDASIVEKTSGNLLFSFDPSGHASFSESDNVTVSRGDLVYQAVYGEESGWIFSHWECDGCEPVDALSKETYFKVTCVDDPTAVAKMIEASSQSYTVTVNSSRGGSVSPFDNGRSNEFFYGFRLRLTGVPDSGFRVKSWTGVPVYVDSTKRVVEFLVTENMTIYCDFERVVGGGDDAYETGSKLWERFTTSLDSVGLGGTMGRMMAVIVGMSVAFFLTRKHGAFRIMAPVAVLGLGIVGGWVPIWITVVLSLAVAGFILLVWKRGVE